MFRRRLPGGVTAGDPGGLRRRLSKAYRLDPLIKMSDMAAIAGSRPEK